MVIFLELLILLIIVQVELLTEGNIAGRHLTYYSISATVKKMLDKMKYYKYKHWVNRGFFLGAKHSKVYGYLGWYNSSNGGQMPADYKPSSYSFRCTWYFLFHIYNILNYKEE